MSKDMRAPSRLKSKIYSALLERPRKDGPLLSLSEVKARGRKLCVFEELVQIAPVGDAIKQPNLCRLCHARMAENVENAPVYWPGWPDAQFQNR
jgi:hypothetical protein